MVKKKKKSIEIIKKEIILLENNTNKNIEEKQSYLNLIKQILEYQIHNKLNIQKLLKILKPNNQTIIYWIYKYSKNNNVYKKIVKNYHNYFTKSDINDIKYEIFIYYIKNQTAKLYWNDNIKKISDTIFLPIKKNFKESKIPKILNDTWFNCNVIKSTQQNTKKIECIKERIHKPMIKKSIKIKLFLNKDQQKCIKDFFNCFRYFYNRAISYIINYNKKNQNTFIFTEPFNETTKINIDLQNEKNKFSYITMRKYIKNNKPKWMFSNMPSHMIDLAFKEASDNYSKCIKMYNTKNKKFKLHFKNNKKIQTMFIEKTAFSIKNNNVSIYKNYKNPYKIYTKNKKHKNFVFRDLKISEKIHKYDICDSTISYNKYTNEYYLNLTYNYNINKEKNKIKKEEKTKKILKTKKVVSNDPGDRTFATLYSDNKVIEIGKETKNIIYKLCKEIDILTSIISKKYYTKKMKDKTIKKYTLTNKRKKRLKRALHLKYKKLKNKKVELHNKTVNYLITNYSRIIHPPFETSKMVSNLHSKVARSMNTLSFYEFKIKLRRKCEEYNIELIEEDEHYTSKTCCNCGKLNNKLGNKKIFECLNCKMIMKRDIVGSRGIMLKNNIWN